MYERSHNKMGMKESRWQEEVEEEQTGDSYQCQEVNRWESKLDNAENQKTP